MLFSVHRSTLGSLSAAAALLVALAIALMPQLASAQSGGFNTRAKAAVLLDADTGAILYQNNADELLAPASVSKLMTAEVVFRALKEGKLKLTDEFTMSEHAWRTGGAPSRTSSMFVPINTPATIDDLLKGLLIQSGNDAAICLAEGLSGSEAKFAERMTAEARRLGLTKSTFANPSGLYDPGQQMTAREIALLAHHLIKEYPEYYPIFSQRLFEYRKHKFYNRNPLLPLDIGADGLKTGYIKESGYNLVGSAVQNGKRLIVVVMGLPTESDRTSEAKKLLDWGYRSFAPFKLFNAGETVGSARVWGGEQFYVPLTGDGPISVILPRVPENPRLKAEIIYDGPLKPPVKKGDRVATLRVTSQTNQVNEVPLYAAQDVEPGGLVRRGLDSLAHLALSWVPL
ncbi:D-alanyl-D-alanine carboxypeptidase family protein [Hyphomicrobium sp. NDB2Meth4]|uniref:D-alanyl-D-alanine carboxypeptidase family protein n=1 Tax=Hyphomicrobium sp. NDB2Meth4 TaxID=1892846 RepID=UPI00092FDBFD|nr:D-alanyl-D-alanine carboxypeptidase family protein [Hyphomicrobium sp. NDB2Meth4]